MVPRALRERLGPHVVEQEMARFPVGDDEILGALTPGAAERLQQEVGFVSRFARSSPLAFPTYESLVSGAPVLVRRASPAGAVEPTQALFAELAPLLTWLDALSTDDALDAGVRLRAASHHNFARAYLAAQRAYADLRGVLDDATRERCDRLFDAPPPPLPRDRLHVVHPRLGAASLWRDRAGRLIVGGWGWADFADRSAGLFRLYQWGGAAVLADLAVDDPALAERTVFLGRCAALVELSIARGRGDGPAASQARRALSWPDR